MDVLRDFLMGHAGVFKLLQPHRRDRLLELPAARKHFKGNWRIVGMSLQCTLRRGGTQIRVGARHRFSKSRVPVAPLT